MATLEATVAVEKVIHDALREAIQRISDEHGIQVESVSVDWFDVSSYDRPNFKVQTVRAHTFSRHG